jgi:hypothetical protein
MDPTDERLTPELSGVFAESARLFVAQHEEDLFPLFRITILWAESFISEDPAASIFRAESTRYYYPGEKV